MRRVGIKQLKDEAPALLAGGETLVIERRGVPVAVVVPLEAMDRQRKARALADFGDAVQAFLNEHGLGGDDFEAAVARDAPDR